MQRSASRLTPFYGLQAIDVEVDPEGASEHPVTVTLGHVEGPEATGETSTIAARYVVGCDGARSATRAAIGRELVGDATDESWGVMDVLAVTDFPDIRLKSAISSTQGNVLIIPREGGYLVRFYIELDEVSRRGMRDNRSVTPEKLAEVANRILHPYRLELEDVGWWSVYEIGQRLCDRFDDVPADEIATRLPRVFIAGDACHTHSAKAGQGMNVSMADTWNLGWKLAAVLRGTAKPELLHTYSEERQAVAKELIDFDREFSRQFRSRPAESDGADGADGVDPEEFQRYFAAQGRFTAGVATRYAPSMITAEATARGLAEGFPVGMRFHSAPVIRLADAKPVHLGHVARADGAWRVYIFADGDDPTGESSRARRLCEFLASDASPLTRFTPAAADPDAVIDVRAVFQHGHRDLSVDEMPAVLLPRKGRFGLVDYEKIFCPDPAADDIFDLRGVNRDTGCTVVVRPDQYISHVLPLHEHEALASFFARILIDAG
jgi:phenol 2-monooxygenase